jgi:hypothetical protein
MAALSLFFPEFASIVWPRGRLERKKRRRRGMELIEKGGVQSFPFSC